MPEIEARINEFLNEKLAPSPGRKPSSIGRSLPVRIRMGLLETVIALITLIERAAACWKARCARWQASTSVVQASLSARDALRQELTDHLRDAYDRQLEMGRDPESAWAHVTEHFGDYEAILGELETLHFIPLWEWVTRALALPLAMFLMETVFYGGYVSLRLKDFVRMDLLIIFFLAAPLASFDTRIWGWPGWLRQVTRVLAGYLFFWVSNYGAGFPWPDCLMVAAGLVLAAALGRPFSSPRFATRVRAFMVAATVGTILLCARLFMASLETHLPTNLGYGVVISFVIIFHGVLFGRPGWPALLFVTAYCQWILLFIGYTAMPPDHFFFHDRINADFFMTPANCTVLAFLAGWTFYGRRAYTHWIPAIGVIGMVLTYLARMRSLYDPHYSLQGIMLAASLPLLLWLAPVGMVIVEQFRKTRQSRLP